MLGLADAVPVEVNTMMMPTLMYFSHSDGNTYERLIISIDQLIGMTADGYTVTDRYSAEVAYYQDRLFGFSGCGRRAWRTEVN